MQVYMYVHIYTCENSKKVCKVLRVESREILSQPGTWGLFCSFLSAIISFPPGPPSFQIPVTSLSLSGRLP